MHEAMHVVDPILKFFVVFCIIRVVRLLRKSTRESVRAVLDARDMNKCEMEEENSNDPMVDRCVRGYIGVL